MKLKIILSILLFCCGPFSLASSDQKVKTLNLFSNAKKPTPSQMKQYCEKRRARGESVQECVARLKKL